MSGKPPLYARALNAEINGTLEFDVFDLGISNTILFLVRCLVGEEVET